MYSNKYNLHERLIESNKIKKKYPDRIPVIIEKEESSELPSLTQIKYLSPINITIGELMMVVRKRMHIKEKESIFFYNKETMLSNSQLVCHLYETCKEEDGFLYITYSNEKTFG